jgi:hypothetical protein
LRAFSAIARVALPPPQRQRRQHHALHRAGTSGDPTSTLLKNCAGSAGKYPDADKLFLLTSASAIITTFAQIGSSLSNLRVAK